MVCRSERKWRCETMDKRNAQFAKLTCLDVEFPCCALRIAQEDPSSRLSASRSIRIISSRAASISTRADFERVRSALLS